MVSSKPSQWFCRLVSVPQVHTDVSRDDISGACAFDIPIRYPLPPPHLLQALSTPVPILISPRLLNIVSQWTYASVNQKDVIFALRDLYILNEVIKLEQPRVWKDPMLLGMHVNPILHRLLFSREGVENIEGYKGESGIANAVKLAAVLYLKDIRQKLMIFMIMGQHIFERLEKALLDMTIDWSQFLDLKLWVLVVAGINAPVGDTWWIIDGIVAAMRELGVNHWAEVLKISEYFLWLDSIFGDRGRELGNVVMGRYSCIMMCSTATGTHCKENSNFEF